MSTLSNELDKQLDILIDDYFPKLKRHARGQAILMREPLKALIATQNTALLKELLKHKHELLSAAYTTENGYVKVDISSGNPIEMPAVPVSVINSKLAAMGGQL